MSDSGQNITMNEAAGLFLASLPSGESGPSQQQIYKSVRWFGKERPFSGLAAADVEKYAEQLSLSDTDYLAKFKLVKSFLVYARKKGWSKTNLATHLKARKSSFKSAAASNNAPEPIPMTSQGLSELEAEIDTLKNERHEAINEMRKAAADKDFKENAPLHAARERRSYLEGRIMELESTFKAAVIINEKKGSNSRIAIGDCVILLDSDSGEELRYTLVSPREVDAARGRISSVSPIGQAIMGKKQGDTVEISAPVGRLRFRVKEIEH